MTARINVHCTGNNGTIKITKVADTVTFGTSGNCTFTSFNFIDQNGKSYTPPGFSNRDPATGGGATISYSYDGSPIPEAGYPFAYSTTSPAAGNGSGIIKNT
jgi:hypothetical protein